MKRTITGVKPTGTPHLGNYIGAIKPALELAEGEGQSLYFIADLHALNSIHNKSQLKKLTYEVAATWLALGLNPDRSFFYRQSDIRELTELQWILSSVTNKGLLNRAHAYKAQVDQNRTAGKEEDTGVNMGLFNYPVLMAADLLLMDASDVPVGKDNLQHIEIARDIAEAFHRQYEEAFQLPKPIVSESSAVLPGLDGRKMSKSYQNTIPLFSEEKKLEKLVKRIVTDSTPPEQAKETEGSTLFTLYREFGTETEAAQMADAYKQGIGYGEIKQEVFRVMNRALKQPRQKYYQLLEKPEEIDKLLEAGAEKVRPYAQVKVNKVKEIIGLS